MQCQCGPQCSVSVDHNAVSVWTTVQCQCGPQCSVSVVNAIKHLNKQEMSYFAITLTKEILRRNFSKMINKLNWSYW